MFIVIMSIYALKAVAAVIFLIAAVIFPKLFDEKDTATFREKCHAYLHCYCEREFSC